MAQRESELVRVLREFKRVLRPPLPRCRLARAARAVACARLLDPQVGVDERARSVGARRLPERAPRRVAPVQLVLRLTLRAVAVAAGIDHEVGAAKRVRELHPVLHGRLSGIEVRHVQREAVGRGYAGASQRRHQPLGRADPAEVARVFDVSLRELADTANFHEERWSVPGRETPGSPDGSLAVWFFKVEGEMIWGATARMLHELLSVVLLPPP